MNTYVMGEIATVLAITALAGMLIGWCIKSLFTGRTEKKVREYVARDVDDAAADVKQIQSALQKKDAELRDATVELQQLRGRDVSLKAGNSTQIQEINALKTELAESRQSLDRNRAEFNAFRNEKQTEAQSLTNKLASFQAGGPVYDERIKEANETISALRTAVQENDKIIDSLRARVKEGDQSVDNLRTQLRSAESTSKDVQAAESDRKAELASLNNDLQEISTQRNKYKRDYEQVLESKNAEINRQQTRLDELSSVQALLQKKEHEYDKLNQEGRDLSAQNSAEITELKRAIADREAAQENTQNELKIQLEDINRVTEEAQTAATGYETQIANLQNKLDNTTSELQQAKAELAKTRSVQKEIETKNAEVVALNDLLRDVSGKRDSLQTQVTDVEKQLGVAKANADAAGKAQQQLKVLESTVTDRDSVITSLRTDMNVLTTERGALEAELGELKKNSAKVQQSLTEDAESKISELNNRLQTGDNASKKLRADLEGRNAMLSKLRHDMDELVANRNSLAAELGELQSSSSKTERTLAADSESKLSALNAEMRQRDTNIAQLRSDMAEITSSRDQLARQVTELKARGDQLESFKAEMQETVNSRSSELQQRNAAYSKLQTEFQQLTATRDDYEKRLNELRSRVDEQSRASESEISRLKPQVADLRGQLSLAQSENQRLSEELSGTEELRLTITERDSEIQKLQISSQDAVSVGSLESALEEQSKKTATLTSALQERDTEISRLNAIITDNRVGSKQHSSETTLLKQEIDSQANLIQSLEQQAENTLSLHKKIASQSTEIEELRASLYQAQDSSRPADGFAIQPVDNAELDKQLGKLKEELKAKDTELQNAKSQAVGLQQLQSQNDELKRAVNARNRELQQTRLELASVAATTTSASEAPSVSVSSNTATDKNVTTPATSSKPRVFVRQGVAADALNTIDTSATGRAQYTRDGYRLAGADGRDDLTLLPGIDKTSAKALAQHGINAFEQIARWERREIIHFAERANIPATRAESYNWPQCAVQILDGSYRRDKQAEPLGDA